MLNEIIKIDLHIHSKISEYKESDKSIVANSNKDNVNVLLDRLLENDVCLFSITDHNRFDEELYDSIEKALTEEKYKSLHMLAGVEFDVALEENKTPPHIVTIFDTKNKEDREKIAKAINNNLLQNKNDSYNKSEFEDILRAIGLNTILIVHQKCGLDKNTGRNRSLSQGVEDPYEIIKMGYIQSLEYQKPNVEGIIKNNLKEMNANISLITGSDCHDWSVYPDHSRSRQNNNKYFTKMKALPTFKGLLLALTSPNTRFNRSVTNNTNYIQKFKIGDHIVELDPGINVIIGENGSGKSTLLNILGNSSLESYMDKIKKNNNICSEFDSTKIKLIQQTEIIDKYNKVNKSKMFSEQDENYIAIDNTKYENSYRKFLTSIKNQIQQNIDKKIALKDLDHLNFRIEIKKEEGKTFYVKFEKVLIDIEENKHEERLIQLKNIMESLLEEYSIDYYSENEKNKIKEIIKVLFDLYLSVKKKKDNKKFDDKVKNIINNKTKDYNYKVKELSTSEDNEISNYKSNKALFIKKIVQAIEKNTVKNEKIIFPEVVKGESRNSKNGFVFTREANYSCKDMIQDFLKKMFNSGFQNIDSIMKIDTVNTLVTALKGCTNEEQVVDMWNKNFNKFISETTKYTEHILEESSSDVVGNTLGEISLVYYKYETHDMSKWDVFLVDQPEDNISNNKIGSELVSYFNDVRGDKQLIIVTHNPLLVVNLDADNVIYTSMRNNKLTIKSGCLEDEENEILDIVADTLDGGKEMIERRIKVYG